MKKLIVIAGVALVAGSVQMVSAGDVSGKVTLKGTPPPEIKIPLEQVCGPLHPNGLTTRHYVVGKDGGLGNVFVYVKKGLEGKTFEAPAAPALLDQVGCLYEPYVMGIMTNQKLEIRDSDPFMHNIRVAGPKNNKGFNFAQFKKGQVDTRSFPNPEILIKFNCDVHPWMFAYVSVMEHPFFAVTDKDGNYTIKNLPPGKYTLEIAHLKAGRATEDIEVTSDKKSQDFTLEVKAQK